MTEWTLSMVSVDIVHGLSGHCPVSPWTKSSETSQTGQCPWTEWTLSMDSVDIIHGRSFQYSSRTMSTESMDFLQTGFSDVKSIESITGAKEGNTLP